MDHDPFIHYSCSLFVMDYAPSGTEDRVHTLLRAVSDSHHHHHSPVVMTYGLLRMGSFPVKTVSLLKLQLRV